MIQWCSQCLDLLPVCPTMTNGWRDTGKNQWLQKKHTWWYPNMLVDILYATFTDLLKEPVSAMQVVSLSSKVYSFERHLMTVPTWNFISLKVTCLNKTFNGSSRHFEKVIPGKFQCKITKGNQLWKWKEGKSLVLPVNTLCNTLPLTFLTYKHELSHSTQWCITASLLADMSSLIQFIGVTQLPHLQKRALPFNPLIHHCFLPTEPSFIIQHTDPSLFPYLQPWALPFNRLVHHCFINYRNKLESHSTHWSITASLHQDRSSSIQSTSPSLLSYLQIWALPFTSLVHHCFLPTEPSFIIQPTDPLLLP